MSTINEENDSPEFFNFDGMISPLKDEKKDIQEKKRFNLKLLIIVGSIIIIIILAISIYFFIKLNEPSLECKPGKFFPENSEKKSESDCEKCSL